MDRADTFDRGGLRLSKSGVVNPVWTVPNGLTVLRILLTPVFFLLIFAENWYFKNLALLVFTVASLTDFYDGRIARRDGTVTGLGRFLDPLADKALVSSALISFVILGMVEVWLVVAMVMRDVVIMVFRMYAIHKGKPVVTSRLAKWKTMLQLVIVFFVLIFINIRVIEAKLTSQPLVLISSWSYLVLNGLVAAVTILAVVSGIRYLMDLKRH